MAYVLRLVEQYMGKISRIEKAKLIAAIIYSQDFNIDKAILFLIKKVKDT